MKKIAYLLLLLFFVSCSEFDDFINQGDTTYNAGAIMYGHHFYNGDSNTSNNTIATRTSLKPSDDGTSFSWKSGDVAGVYSYGVGLTNFFIDDSSISSDGTSAVFNGSGFSLTPNSLYYAFYPYNASELDKSSIGVVYTGQTINYNGDFAGLGNYDYMWSRGTTDSEGNVGFNFQHLGCVVEFKMEVPETATYSQVRFELQSGSTAGIIKCGDVDLTDSKPHIKDAGVTKADTIMRVYLNKEEGIAVNKGEILTVYMLMAPQDLSSSTMLIRLVDNKNNWYSATAVGKNMKAGHTYHYYIGQNTTGGGFTGSGNDLPDDFEYRHISTYEHPTISGYEDICIEGNNVYAAGFFGVRKIDYTNESSPTLIAENTNIVRENTRARSIAADNNNLYVTVRYNPWDSNAGTPAIGYDFEKPVTEKTNGLCNNSVVNNFFKKLSVKRDVTKLYTVYLFKAYKRADGYRNSIVFKVTGESDIAFITKSYPTKEEAIAALRDSYTTPSGDYCEVDWNAIPEGPNEYNNLVFNYIRKVQVIKDGDNTISYVSIPSPNRGFKSCLFKKGASSTTNTTAILNNINTTNEGSFSFWICPPKLFSNVIKCLLTWNNSICKLRINLIPTSSGYKLSLSEKGNNSKVFDINQWVNVKVQTSPSGTKLYYRGAECSDWTLLESNTTPSTEFNCVSLGIASSEPGVELLMDDYFFDPHNVDDVTYVNGRIHIMDKTDLSVKKTINLDYRATGVAVANDILVVCGLYGLKFYDVSSPSNPKWLYTYQPPFEKDMQGIATYTANGRTCAFVCCYRSGFMIWDITDKSDIALVADENLKDIMINGTSVDECLNCFGVTVDYPYAYTTISSCPRYLPTHKEYSGVMTVDLSDLSNIKKDVNFIPADQQTSITSGDPAPTRIARYNHTLFVNNRERGVGIFKLQNHRPEFLRNLTFDGRVNVISTTPDGRMFIGDNANDGKLFLERIE